MSERTMGPDPERLASAAAADSIYRRWRFASVLAASLLLAVGQPLTSKLFDEQGSFNVVFSLLIVAVLLLVFEEREHRRIASAFGVTAFLGLWAGDMVSEPASRHVLVATYLVAVCFFAFALFGIIRAVLVRHVTGNAILGALCGYLLLGIIWSLLYSAVETASPGSFAMPAAIGDKIASMPPDRATLNYYSFITLATVGYGDVTPTTPLARTLAWMEAIVGQFYLAVLVAGLVGFKASQAQSK
jgi:voltage-gated potassium channel